MDAVYARLRKQARQIAESFPLPDFYRKFSRQIELSQKLFNSDPILIELKEFVAGHIEDDFGHGLEHAIKVTVDVGALVNIEGLRARYSDTLIERETLLAQCAGLLHDVKRKQKNHAAKSAIFAEQILKAYPLLPDEISDISRAIGNHEAFKTPQKLNTPEGALVSDCLYDADKFRWGPDNFTDTVWGMISFSKTPVSVFIDRYPEGMESLARIKGTFRTHTGKAYGPQFIDIGLAIGKKLYDTIKMDITAT